MWHSSKKGIQLAIILMLVQQLDNIFEIISGGSVFLSPVSHEQWNGNQSTKFFCVIMRCQLKSVPGSATQLHIKMEF